MPPVNVFLPQVTRIPITGPDPYNTLVCVEADTNAAPQDVRKGHLSRWAVTVPTPFRLAGFDQRVPPVFDHSTTAFLGSFGPADDDTWLYAVDTVTGAGFNPVDGSYFVNLNVALLPGDADQTCVSYGSPSPDPTQPSNSVQICYYYVTIRVTSFVLCFEPPPAAPPPPAPGRLPGRFAALVSEVARTRDLVLGAQSLRDVLRAPGSVTLGDAGGMKGKGGGCGRR